MSATSDGELLDKIQARVWYDDGDNINQNDEEVFLEGTLREVLNALSSGKGVPLDGDGTTTEFDEMADPATDADRGCYSAADDVHCIGFEWWIPRSVGNEIRGDSATFDLGFYTEQCRNNDGGGVESETPPITTDAPTEMPTETPTDAPEPEPVYWQVDFGEGESPPDPPSYWPDDVMAALGNSDEGVMDNPSAWRQGNDGQLKNVTITGASFDFDSEDDPTSVTVEFEIDEGASTRDLHIASFVLPGPYEPSEVDQQDLNDVSNGTFGGGDTGQLTVSIPS